MSNYTLEPKIKLTNPWTENIKQLRHFMRVAPKMGVGRFDGISNLVGDIKTVRRWGGFEAGLLEMSARRCPKRLALVDDDGSLTYEELLTYSMNFASGMVSRGYGDGKNIAVLALNGRGSIIPLVARTMVGWNLFMINANSSPRQIEAILRYHDIDLLIVDEEFYSTLLPETASRDIVLAHLDQATNTKHGLETIDDIIQASPGTSTLPRNPSAGRHVVMTSGSTGMPKGVIRRPRKSPQAGAPLIDALPIEPGQVWLLTAVLFHMYGWACLTVALASKATIVTRRHFEAGDVFNLLSGHEIDIWASAASRIRELLSYMDANSIAHVDGLKCLLTSGSPLLPYEVKQSSKHFGPVLTNFYGSSETTTIAITKPGEVDDDPRLSGHIPPGVTVKILGSNKEELPDGKIGNIYIRVFEFFDGYTNPNEEIPTYQGFYAMGDRGYKLGDKLYVEGRADDLVITQYGEKIQPGEIVDLLLHHPSISDAYVHGVPDKRTGQALRAYIVPTRGTALNEDEVRDYIGSNLSAAHRPRDVFFVDDFIRTDTGKVVKRKLPGRSTL